MLGYSFFTAPAPDVVAGSLPPAVDPEANGEWTHYGNSLHATRYSDLAQITPANAANLEQAWVYHAGLQSPDAHSAHLYETTPLMVDGLLYGCTGHSAVFALDPVTGNRSGGMRPRSIFPPVAVGSAVA